MLCSWPGRPTYKKDSGQHVRPASLKILKIWRPALHSASFKQMADFNFITERLAVGAQLNGPDDIKQIIAAGITHIIDAQQERSDGVLIPANCIYLWDPTADDGQHKPPEWFQYAITFALNAFLTPRTRVLTHCAAGVNRGPSLAYAIMRAQGWADEEAMLQLKLKRPQVGVAYHDDANAALVKLGWCV